MPGVYHEWVGVLVKLTSYLTRISASTAMYTILLTSALSYFHSCLETAFGNLVTVRKNQL